MQQFISSWHHIFRSSAFKFMGYIKLEVGYNIQQDLYHLTYLFALIRSNFVALYLSNYWVDFDGTFTV